MKRIMLLVFLVLLLSGCAAYRFQPGSPPYDKGYMVSRDGYSILEYTVGKDNSVPEDLALAKKRFKRRRYVVEHYYKKMGYIENRFKEWFWDPPRYFVKLVTGVFRMPGVAISDYRVRHNPKYKERVLRKEDTLDLKEETITKKLRKVLSDYIQKDLEKEAPVTPESAPEVKKVEAANASSEVATKVRQKKEPKAVVKKPKSAPAPAPKKEAKPVGEPVALIMAKPVKGYSPLLVHFYGGRSYSPHGRIVSYSWDFGDGDTSIKKNPTNTYLSTTYEPREFTVTLTITDYKGNSVSSHQSIEVVNK
ncbi:MAG: PKD domain-containing protein [Candidatus Omnitrophica bacterium]|nr:PKD domain-containing protein [Candidatus Omnitrophota bacterium]